MSCFITNDSGPMHLAAAQGVPMVSLWGPARPEFYAPRVERHEIVYENFRCSPCLFYMFTTFEGLWCGHQGWCMQAIQAARVTEAAERLLADGAGLSTATAGPSASPESAPHATREA
jgi:heptosyltransferase-2